jgi:hypothetical protein
VYRKPIHLRMDPRHLSVTKKARTLFPMEEVGLAVLELA